jgi:hypothetical protein
MNHPPLRWIPLRAYVTKWWLIPKKRTCGSMLYAKCVLGNTTTTPSVCTILLSGIPRLLCVINAKYPNASVEANILGTRRVVYVPSVRRLELITLNHIGVMFYLNAYPKTLRLHSINCLITFTGNAGIVMHSGLDGLSERNQDYKHPLPKPSLKGHRSLMFQPLPNSSLHPRLLMHPLPNPWL